jgi:hypothetical protein
MTLKEIVTTPKRGTWISLLELHPKQKEPYREGLIAAYQHENMAASLTTKLVCSHETIPFRILASRLTTRNIDTEIRKHLDWVSTQWECGYVMDREAVLEFRNTVTETLDSDGESTLVHVTQSRPGVWDATPQHEQVRLDNFK